jgi:proteic killer suppression protein
VIVSFADQGTADIWAGVNSKAARKVLAPELHERAQRLLTRIDYAHNVLDLQVPPSNRLHKLSGDLAGFYSVSINAQFRIIFRFEDGNASAVQILDYH